MNYLKFALVLSTLCLLTVSRAEAARTAREIEAPTETQEANPTGKLQEQLLTAFDNLKKSVEEVTSKINTDEIIKGIQNFTSKLENYARETADKFASTASEISTSETQPKKVFLDIVNSQYALALDETGKRTVKEAEPNPDTLEASPTEKNLDQLLASLNRFKRSLQEKTLKRNRRGSGTSGNSGNGGPIKTGFGNFTEKLEEKIREVADNFAATNLGNNKNKKDKNY